MFKTISALFQKSPCIAKKTRKKGNLHKKRMRTNHSYFVKCLTLKISKYFEIFDIKKERTSLSSTALIIKPIGLILRLVCLILYKVLSLFPYRIILYYHINFLQFVLWFYLWRFHNYILNFLLIRQEFLYISFRQ